MSTLKRTSISAFHAAVRLNIAIRQLDYRYVFVLGHMRSGSTLLSHILASNPDFEGAGEMHLTYKTENDLSHLVTKTCEYLHRFQLNGKYVVDQINHNQFLDPDCLSSPLIHRCIILIRQPEPSLKSIISVIGTPEPEAVEYYVHRLAMLTEYGNILRDRALLIEYEQLIDQTTETLSALSDFISARLPFTMKYRTTRATGIIGDPSKNISMGFIVRPNENNTVIKEGSVSEASIAFDRCRLALRSFGVRSVAN